MSKFTDYLGGSTIAPLVMSDERWEKVKEELKSKDRTCPVCKKKFSPPNVTEWAYRTPKHVFCSWTCMRKHQKAEESKKPKKRTKKEVGW